MRICFLAAADSIHSHKWIKFFAQRGHNVLWISFAPPEFGGIDGVQFHQLESSSIKPLSIPGYTLKVRKLIRDFAPDIVHAHYVGTYGLVGALSGFSPLVLTAWGSDILFAGKSFLKAPFVKYALGRSALVTCDAYHMVDAMKGYLGVPEQKIKIIYFGIDTGRFSPGEKSAAIREELGVGDAPMVISLRSFDPVYNIESLIKAVPLVLAKVPGAKFVLAGTGPEEDMLKGLAERLGVSRSINFIGRYDNEVLPDYLRSADAYVSTSLSDAGIAASTAEAMACGLPVVITDSGENGKWVQDGVNGFLVPVKDPAALAEKTIVLLRDNELKKNFSVKGRQTIVERNDYHGEMYRMLDIYKEAFDEQD